VHDGCGVGPKAELAGDVAQVVNDGLSLDIRAGEEALDQEAFTENLGGEPWSMEGSVLIFSGRPSPLHTLFGVLPEHPANDRSSSQFSPQHLRVRLA
jgi:hypothetical protein